MERRKNVKRGSLRDMAREGIEWIRRILEEKGDRSVRGKEEDMQKKAAGSGRISMMFCLLPAVLCFILMFQICALGEPISDQPSPLPEYIHYENLEELIKSHSPQVQMERFSYEKRLGMYENAWEEMKETRRLLREEAESLEDEGDEEGAAQYREQAEVLEECSGGNGGTDPPCQGKFSYYVPQADGRHSFVECPEPDGFLSYAEGRAGKCPCAIPMER